MKLLSLVFETSCSLFKKGAKRVNGANTGIKRGDAKPLITPKTVCFTDIATGNQIMERPITRNGKEAIARVETLSDGTVRTTIKGGGDNDITRIKKITRENNTSVFGGNQITIEKDTTKYWCHQEKINLRKEYNPNGIAEHIELDFVHNSGNGLNDYKHFAILDRVYNEKPLTHSVKEMLKNPEEHKYYQHSLDMRNNYHNFTAKDTIYTRAIESKKQAAIEATEKLEKEKQAATLAAKQIAEELKAKQPRMNIGKLLGLNIDELKVVEKVQQNGAIKRYYFLPETGVGKRKPVIITYDHGILHTEKIIGSPKADMIYMKQVGENTPYIIAKKGNYTQVSTLNDFSELTNTQYYNDGIASLKYNYCGDKIRSSNGKIQINDERATELMEIDSYYKKIFPEFPNIHVIDGELTLPPSSNWRPIRQKFQNHIYQLKQEAQKNYIDLNDLSKNFEA